VVTNLICQSLNTCCLPRAWKEPWITPVFRSGARCNPANYCPISLTCIVCKLAEHILSSHIRQHLDKCGILTSANRGFRSRHSCESQLLLTTHDLLKKRDQGHSIDVGILDFSKAFDTVPHKRLISKLRIYGIHGEVISWIETFLLCRQQLVLCDGFKSEYSAVTSGVHCSPRNSIGATSVFLLHINDLPSVVDPGTSVRLFADDTLIYRVIHSMEDQVALQRDLARLEQWGESWGMVFNAPKCHIMHVSRSSSIHPHTSTCISSVVLFCRRWPVRNTLESTSTMITNDHITSIKSQQRQQGSWDLWDVTSEVHQLIVKSWLISH